MTTTDGEERVGNFLHIEGLEVAVLYEETSGNQVDLDNFAELFKLGQVVTHKVLFSVDQC